MADRAGRFRVDWGGADARFESSCIRSDGVVVARDDCVSQRNRFGAYVGGNKNRDQNRSR